MCELNKGMWYQGSVKGLRKLRCGSDGEEYGRRNRIKV